PLRLEAEELAADALELLLGEDLRLLGFLGRLLRLLGRRSVLGDRGAETGAEGHERCEQGPSATHATPRRGRHCIWNARLWKTPDRMDETEMGRRGRNDDTSLVAQRFDRVELARSPGGVEAEDDADRGREADRGGDRGRRDELGRV